MRRKQKGKKLEASFKSAFLTLVQWRRLWLQKLAIHLFPVASSVCMMTLRCQDELFYAANRGHNGSSALGASMVTAVFAVWEAHKVRRPGVSIHTLTQFKMGFMLHALYVDLFRPHQRVVHRGAIRTEEHWAYRERGRSRSPSSRDLSAPTVSHPTSFMRVSSDHTKVWFFDDLLGQDGIWKEVDSERKIMITRKKNREAAWR